MQTRTVLQDLINSITKTINVISTSDDGSLVTLEVDNTFWLMGKQRLTIDNTEYKINSLVNTTMILRPLDAFSPVTVSSFQIAPPPIFAGTYRMVKHEVNAIPQKNTINPMIWIREVIDDDFDTNEESAIDHSTNVNIYFVGAADYENWLTEKHYEKVIEPLNELVEEFLYKFNMSKFITDENTFSKVALVNISVGGDQVESIFDLNLSGIEVSLSAEIRKDLSSKLVCAPDNTKFGLKALAKQFEVPSEGCIKIDINEVTENTTGRAATFKSVESNDDFTATISQDKTSVEICTDRSTIELTGLNFTATNGVVDAVGIIAVGVQATAAFGIQYQPAINGWSQLTISYAIGDEGWRYQNGEFDTFILGNPATIATLDESAPNPFLTLVDNNIFGNKNRFTDKDGLQVYPKFTLTSGTTTSNDFTLYIDHLYGCVIAWFHNDVVNPNFFNWPEAIAARTIINEGGYTDFSIASIKEIDRYANLENLGDAYNYPPFDIAGLNRQILSSTPGLPPTSRQVLGTFNGIGRAQADRIDDKRNPMFIKNIQEQLQPT